MFLVTWLSSKIIMDQGLQNGGWMMVRLGPGPHGIEIWPNVGFKEI